MSCPLLRRAVVPLLACVLLAACSGVPLASLPRLAALQSELLEGNPAELMLAIQVDQRIHPPAGAVPLLQLAIRPREPGAFEAWERSIPLRMGSGEAPAGLPRAGRGRHWLVYSLGPQAQAELLQARARLRQLQAERKGKSGGSVGVGIAQEGVAAQSPQLPGTEWDSWLQTSAQAGFFRLWSGTLEELKAQARGAAR